MTTGVSARRAPIHDQPRCEFDGRLISLTYAAYWAWFAAETVAFCRDCGQSLPRGYEARQVELRERLAGGAAGR